MVVLEIIALSAFKKNVRKNRFVSPVIETVKKLDPDETLKKMRAERMRRMRMNQQRRFL